MTDWLCSHNDSTAPTSLTNSLLSTTGMDTGADPTLFSPHLSLTWLMSEKEREDTPLTARHSRLHMSLSRTAEAESVGQMFANRLVARACPWPWVGRTLLSRKKSIITVSLKLDAVRMPPFQHWLAGQCHGVRSNGYTCNQEQSDSRS